MQVTWQVLVGLLPQHPKHAGDTAASCRFATALTTAFRWQVLLGLLPHWPCKACRWQVLLGLLPHWPKHAGHCGHYHANKKYYKYKYIYIIIYIYLYLGSILFLKYICIYIHISLCSLHADSWALLVALLVAYSLGMFLFWGAFFRKNGAVGKPSHFFPKGKNPLITLLVL